VEPAAQFNALAEESYPVWLDSAGGGRFSILAANPSLVLRAKGGAIELHSPAGIERAAGNPFDILNAELAKREAADASPFPVGAAIGYFGYDLKQFVERLPARAVDDIGLPDCWFGFYEHLFVFDRAQRTVFEVGRAGPARRVVDRIAARSANAPDRSNFTRVTYRHAVLRAKDYIAAGDIYQVNLSQRFQCDVDVPARRLYEALRITNPAPYGAFLDIGEAQILSSSPECFLDIQGRHVMTRPIKGTRPRAADPNELLRSPKDNAELLMIVDLERNDLGRVCEFGSVRVRELKRVESFATVHHLVATVEGSLRGDVSHVDCVRACFPGGSITGAPKIRAMEIIDELEPHARGIYTGAIGFLGFNGVSRLNVAIRTAVYQSGRLTFQAGGGIVADSDPDAEYDETLAKAAGLFAAVERVSQPRMNADRRE
jgi:para-aminobenzoate synthetase component 1